MVAILAIMELGDLPEKKNRKIYEKEVAILAIMELGDLLNFGFVAFSCYDVAILAIMELGDLRLTFLSTFRTMKESQSSL